MHSHSSSLEDDYYTTDSPSQTTATSTSTTSRSSHTSASAARKNASLARIAVPSFLSFRSKVPQQPRSDIPGSPRAASISLSQSSPRLIQPDIRPISVSGALTPQEVYRANGRLAPVTGERGGLGQEERPAQSFPQPRHGREESLDSQIASSIASSAYSARSDSPNPHAGKGHALAPPTSHKDQPPTLSLTQRIHATATSMSGRKPPTMTLQQFDDVNRTLSEESLHEPLKSPIGRLGSLFGWKSPQGRSEGETSPTTTFSERSLSPVPSPMMRTQVMDNSSAHLALPTLETQKSLSDGAYFDHADSSLLVGDNATNVHVRELERELAHISQELAGSIRREMELEDELDRIRAEFPAASEGSHRTSDYFSDSGTSSLRFPVTDVDAKVEQLEKHVRKVEQDKANMKNEHASRLQTELARRRELEESLREMENQFGKKTSEPHLEERLAELEYALDETRRRLGQEKEAKENFEDLYSATREELEKHRNERENLRDGNNRMQHELSAYHSRYGRDSIAEEGFDSVARMALSRSGSLARKSSLRRGTQALEGGRQRSGSNGLPHIDGLKEIEDQRDALHKALKLLIKRHERQQRDHERAIKVLTSAKNRAELVSPNRSAYSKEVAFLKEEVSVLRKRTEDALEQKWEYEKGLSGLKMDLDAAEQETRGLRILLQGQDISGHIRSPTSSDNGLEEGAAADKLKYSISTAENERDQARKVAAEYRNRAQENKNGRSAELLESARRMDELADKLGAQVDANLELRTRLAQAVAKGEQEQKQSTRQIQEMQKRLAGMEDSVLAAQQHSETTLATHDAEVRRIEDATSPRLQRLHVDIPDATRLSPLSPLLKKSPKLLSKKLSESSLLEVSRTQMLERKVKELEGLLREAEEDVQTVVARVNSSQMEVADLQTERDAALVQMHKLQALVVQERERAESLM